MHTSKGRYVYFTDDIDILWSEANELMEGGVKESTHRVYSTAQRDFTRFCQEHELTVMPTNERILMIYLFIQKALKYNSIKFYLFAIMHMHVLKGYKIHSTSVQDFN